MAIALVSNIEAMPGATGGTSGSIDTTGATLLVIYVSSYRAPSTISDSKSNTWTPLTEYTDGGDRHSRIWYAENPTVGSGHTFTVSGTDVYPWIGVAAFSGVATSSPFDVQNGAFSAAVSSLATGSVTPSEDNELLITGMCHLTAATPSIDLGFTITDSEGTVGGVNMQGGLAYLIETTAAAKNPTWTFGSSSTGAVSIATFKAGAAAAGQPTAKRWGGVEFGASRFHQGQGVKGW